MKKLIAMLIAAVVVVLPVACFKNEASTPVSETEVVSEKPLTFGIICLHDSNSTYDKNFLDAFNAACEAKGVVTVIKTGIPETSECYEAAADLVDRGCDVVFADSFGHENFILQAAKTYPNVEFCHATGTLAHTENLPNFHDAFASIYEGRYLDGVALGMKLNEMITTGVISEEEAVIGYCSAYPYAECCSGFTSFYLGARSICPSATMIVRYTGSWYDEALEKEIANSLISDGCVVLSGHADSHGLPTAAEEAKVPFVFYNGSVANEAPNSFIISTKINWQPYFEYVIDCVRDGKPIDTDWTGTLSTGSVEMTALNEAVAAPGTKEKLEEVASQFTNGSLKVFDVSTFTVNGETLTEYMADVDSDEAYTPDTSVISDGYFHESEYRSAPYFDLTIDGITVK